jgi:septal ring factor EnvC (AmiA/AmiB activator)
MNERMRALQREADDLAGQAQSLVSSLRRLEVERDLRVAELRQAETAAAEAEARLKATTERLSALELRRLREFPDVRTQLVDLYKRRRSGYAELLFNVANLREFARAARAVSALASITRRRISEHQSTLESLRTERAAFEETARSLKAREAEARRTQRSATEAVANAAALIEQIDGRRDLAARYVGELQVATDRLERRVAALGSANGSAAFVVPIRPFQGTLEWPAPGPVLSAFGEPSSRLGGSVAANGIEIDAPDDAPVRAVHGGTVGFAGTFAGFGTLVILDHGGNNFSLYGYLRSTQLGQGQTVVRGAEVGRVGSAPAGPVALFFELRIDGRPVNPVQWLKPR